MNYQAYPSDQVYGQPQGQPVYASPMPVSPNGNMASPMGQSSIGMVPTPQVQPGYPPGPQFVQPMPAVVVGAQQQPAYGMMPQPQVTNFQDLSSQFYVTILCPETCGAPMMTFEIRPPTMYGDLDESQIPLCVAESSPSKRWEHRCSLFGQTYVIATNGNYSTSNIVVRNETKNEHIATITRKSDCSTYTFTVSIPRGTGMTARCMMGDGYGGSVTVSEGHGAGVIATYKLDQCSSNKLNALVSMAPKPHPTLDIPSRMMIYTALLRSIRAVSDSSGSGTVVVVA